jgi:4-hydroxythreonine-4-phosphate dehydrogenase
MNMSDTEKPIVAGITHGDTNGVGYELITKVLAEPQMMEICTPLVFGSSKAASYHRKTLKSIGGDFSFNVLKQFNQPNQLNLRKPNILNITDEEIKIELGEATAVGGRMALKSLQTAVDHWINRKIDVLVTAPVNKHTIEIDGFVGHTEYLASICKTEEYLMLMIADKLRIGTVTTHIPLAKVPHAITKDLIIHKLKILHQSMMRDFCIVKPSIAVLSLNPHAGENGQFGKEEKAAIIPAVHEAFDNGMNVFGPYAADGLFSTREYTRFDVILAMYHDQAMLPFKLLADGQGVNYTAGLPFVRTSPAHGTAYNIAGKDMASPDSMRNAIYLACDIFRNRTFLAPSSESLQQTNKQ